MKKLTAFIFINSFMCLLVSVGILWQLKTHQCISPKPKPSNPEPLKFERRYDHFVTPAKLRVEADPSASKIMINNRRQTVIWHGDEGKWTTGNIYRDADKVGIWIKASMGGENLHIEQKGVCFVVTDDGKLMSCLRPRHDF